MGPSLGVLSPRCQRTDGLGHSGGASARGRGGQRGDGAVGAGGRAAALRAEAEDVAAEEVRVVPRRPEAVGAAPVEVVVQAAGAEMISTSE